MFYPLFYCFAVEAEDVALVVLRQVMEEKLTPFNVEVASIPVDSKK